MSLKSSLWRYLGLLAVAALAVGVFAGPASAKKLSAKQRAAVRKQLRKQIKKHPGVIKRKSFVKRASLVNFTLPVTIKLRGINPYTNTNPNSAHIDLGTSLGQRDLGLAGSLAAQIQFHDSYDGGALGNVDLKILDSQTKVLQSTSLPLLWNTQVSDPTSQWNSSLIGAPNEGCGDFSGSTNVGFPNTPFPGVPYYTSYNPASTANTPAGYLPEIPGVDGLNNLAASPVPGLNNVGPNPNPFPSGGVTDPNTNAPYAPSFKDAVLRTGPLALRVASPGTSVDMTNGNTTNTPEDSQNIVIGQSGGQANLFGNIPGKDYGIDVTVSLETKINSILRSVGPDGSPLIAGQPYPGAAFACRQAWTGTVQNYIPGIHLKGSLHISPAIDRNGDLRIAKASLSSLGDPAHLALAACLAPERPFAADSSNPSATVPDGTATPDGNGLDQTTRPIDETAPSAAPSDACNTVQSPQVSSAGFTGIADPTDPAYSTLDNGSKVSVAGDISVNDVEADVLIGDVN